MRVLSLIPALFLAATSFVVAAPTTTPSVPAVPSTSAPSCVSSTVPSSGGSSGGDDSSLQVFIGIFANATTEIQTYCDQLSSQEGAPDVDTVTSITVKITAIISETVTELKAQAEVDLTGLDVTNLCAAIYALLTLVLTTLNVLVTIVLKLAGNAVGTLQTVICNLLNAVTDLVGCLKIFVNATLSGVLGPIISLVCGVVDLLLAIVGGLNLLVAVAH